MSHRKEKLTGTDLPPLLAQLRQKLRNKFEQEAVQLPGSEPKSSDYESEEVLLNDVFVKLNILSKSQLDRIAGHEAAQGSVSEMERMAHTFSRGAARMKPIQLGQILRLASKRRRRLLKKLGVRVLALAGAGVGKTTSFLKKGALDWAEGNIWKNIDLLFALPLRKPSVHLAEDLEELFDLKGHGFHSQTDREEICNYISKNLNRVCIILDGLDEVNLSQCSDFVLEIIQGVSMDGVRLIVTSRPSIPVLQLAKKHPFNERLEVLGFSQEDVAQYVGKILRSDDAEEVMRQVNASPSLAGLMQIPLNAANICMLYRSGIKTLPTSMPSVVTSVIHQVIKQNQEKKLEEMDADEDFSKLDPMLLDPVKELAAFAFRTLVDKVLVFEKHHFIEHKLSKEALSLGLLVACDKNSPHSQPQFVFYHLSMHEGFAAHHVASFLTCADDVTWLVDTLGGLSGHLNTFWRFLAAKLDLPSVNSMIGALLSTPNIETGSGGQCLVDETVGSIDYHASGVRHFLSASHAEICKLADNISSHMDISSAERLAERLLEGVVAGSGTAAVRAAMQQGRPLTGVEFLRELLFFWKSRVPRASSHMLHCAISDFDKAMATKCFPDFGGLTADSSSRKPVYQNSEDGQQLLLLSSHCYREFCISNGVFPIMESLYLALEKSSSFYLADSHLTLSDCQAVGFVLQHYNSVISQITFVFCEIGDTGYSQLADGLEMCRNLKFLSMGGNNLTDQHASHIAMVIRNNAATLDILDTSFNKFSSAGNAAMHNHTHRCEQLRIIGMGGSSCTDSSLNISTLCTVLSGCQHVTRLFLAEYSLDVEGLVQLFTLLSGRECTRLNLSKIGLDESYAPVIKLLLQDHRDFLEHLILTGNDLSLEFLFNIYDELCQCTRLQVCQLGNCGLSSMSLSVIASILPYWPELTTLDLSNNDFTEAADVCESFVAAVQSCVKLKLLKMPDRGFVNADLAAALDALADDWLEVAFEDESYWHRDCDDGGTSSGFSVEDEEESDDDSA